MNDLTTEKPELYDLVHAVLPTKMPLKEFYEAYVKMYSRIATPFDYLKVISKYGRGRRLSALKDLMASFNEFKQDVFGAIAGGSR
ncbi:MAG: hypothetical protein AB1500_02955 [Bacillota bacterium]